MELVRNTYFFYPYFAEGKEVIIVILMQHFATPSISGNIKILQTRLAASLSSYNILQQERTHGNSQIVIIWTRTLLFLAFVSCESLLIKSSVGTSQEDKRLPALSNS